MAIQIHELNEFSGIPGTGDWLAIDDGDDTAKVEMFTAVKAIADSEIAEIIKNQIWYGTSSTGAGTAAKVVTCPGFTLKTGETIAVKFTNTNTVIAPTLNVNGTGAKTIVTKTTTSTLKGAWSAGSIVLFTYDGTNWVQTVADNDIDSSVITLFTSLGWTQD